VGEEMAYQAEAGAISVWTITPAQSAKSFPPQGGNHVKFDDVRPIRGPDRHEGVRQMAQTQFEPRNRSVSIADAVAFVPVVLLVLFVLIRSLV
jgi:hypothetical protein